MEGKEVSRTSGASDLVDVEADLMFETEKAYKIKCGSSEPVWVPKSICEYDGKVTFTMPERFAYDKRLI